MGTMKPTEATTVTCTICHLELRRFGRSGALVCPVHGTRGTNPVAPSLPHDPPPPRPARPRERLSTPAEEADEWATL